MSDGMSREEWEALPPILTPEQVARVTGVTRDRVMRWAVAGTFPGHKIGRQWRFPKSALQFGTQHDNGSSSDGTADRPGSR